MSTDKNKLIPVLRFPEFADEEKWVEKALGEVANIVASGDLDKDSYSSEPTNKHTIPIYSNSVSNEGLYGYNTYSKFQPNSVTITARGTLGVAFVRNTEFIGIGRLLVASDLKKIDSVFLKENWNHYAEVPIENGGIPQLTAVKAKRVSLLFPKFEEQQKIASCLSSLDEVIAAQSQKLATLKDHKKGLMQNLFPTNSITNDELEITNVPNYRFPEFLEDGDWVEKKLEEVATFLKGKGISKADIVENGNLACIRYGELYTHYQETINEIKSYTNLNATDLVLSKANDVIIPASGETQIDIATASCVLEKGIALGGDLNIIRTKINGVFLSYYLNNAKKMEIAQMAQGISVVHLYPSQLKTLVINIPKPEEQQKIASCLSTLEDLITAQTEKIAQLKLHKKGLMQGLFPGSITN
jgi:type I restriction enzyme S subunit